MDAQTGRADAQTGRADAQTGRADAQTGKADAQTGSADAQSDLSLRFAHIYMCSKTCLKRPFKNRQNKDLDDKW